MTRGEDGVYTSSLDAKGANLKVWMTAGDDRTEQANIAVVPRLEIVHVEMDVTPPAYTKLETQPVDLSSGPALVVDGSKLALHVTFNKALDAKYPVKLEAASPEFAGKIPAAVWSVDGRNSPMAVWSAKDSFRFHISARDTDGFANKGLEEYEVTQVAGPDAVGQSSKTARRDRGNARHRRPINTLQVHAEDDFGISTMKLIVDREVNAKTTHIRPVRSIIGKSR